MYVLVAAGEESARRREGLMFTWWHSGRACQICRLSTVQSQPSPSALNGDHITGHLKNCLGLVFVAYLLWPSATMYM